MKARPLVRAGVLAFATTLVTALVSGPLVACGAFLDLEPLQFDTSASDGSVQDAPNAIADGGTHDASPASDGAPPPSTHCSDGKAHDFCDDFEGIVGEVQDRWQKRRELVGTGALAAYALPDASPPTTVLDTSIGRGEDGGTTVHIARLSRQESPWPRTASGAQPGVRIALEVRFERLDDPNAPTAIAGIILGATAFGEDFLSIYAWQEEKKVRFRLQEEYRGEDGGPRYAGKDLAVIGEVGVVIPIELEVGERAAGLAGGATVRIGATSESYGLASTSRTTYFRSDIGVSVGTYAGANARALFDNVRMDYLP